MYISCIEEDIGTFILKDSCKLSFLCRALHSTKNMFVGINVLLTSLVMFVRTL
jgi:hypothetical protein